MFRTFCKLMTFVCIYFILLILGVMIYQAIESTRPPFEKVFVVSSVVGTIEQTPIPND